jgi:hypothetical protein
MFVLIILVLTIILFIVAVVSDAKVSWKYGIAAFVSTILCAIFGLYSQVHPDYKLYAKEQVGNTIIYRYKDSNSSFFHAPNGDTFYISIAGSPKIQVQEEEVKKKLYPKEEAGKVKEHIFD